METFKVIALNQSIGCIGCYSSASWRRFIGMFFNQSPLPPFQGGLAHGSFLKSEYKLIIRLYWLFIPPS
jgi:hypothetical protein